jgi:hypothetical protein
MAWRWDTAYSTPDRIGHSTDMNLQSEVRKLIKDAEKRGWKFSGGGNRHYKGVHQTTRATITISASPSSPYVLKMAAGHLRHGERSQARALSPLCVT